MLLHSFFCIKVNCNPFLGGWGGFGGEPLGPVGPVGPVGPAPFPPAVGPGFNLAPNGFAQTYWNNHYYPYFPADYAGQMTLGKR